MTHTWDVVIVGGGLAGSVAANALKKRFIYPTFRKALLTFKVEK
ncbi:tryptophan 7-halogenase [Sediminibacillus dalangtanensis]|nr:tryptophan 7-halogenase [Sediminibacillus dalangtanensis]